MLITKFIHVAEASLKLGNMYSLFSIMGALTFPQVSLTHCPTHPPPPPSVHLYGVIYCGDFLLHFYAATAA